MKKVADAGDAGRYIHQPQLANQNADLSWTGRAQAPGYWYQDKNALVKEGVPVTADYELVKQCSAKLDHGYVRYIGSDAPAPGAGVGVYITNSHTPDVTVQADENGRFVLNRTVGLGYNNAATNYKAEASPPVDAPAGTTGSSNYFQL